MTIDGVNCASTFNDGCEVVLPRERECDLFCPFATACEFCLGRACMLASHTALFFLSETFGVLFVFIRDSSFRGVPCLVLETQAWERPDSCCFSYLFLKTCSFSSSSRSSAEGGGGSRCSPSRRPVTSCNHRLRGDRGAGREVEELCKRGRLLVRKGVGCGIVDNQTGKRELHCCYLQRTVKIKEFSH
jgi:hypothetical protein